MNPSFYSTVTLINRIFSFSKPPVQPYNSMRRLQPACGFQAGAGLKKMEQLVVTRESIEAYERRTGFAGTGEFFLQKGLFVLVERETQKNKVGSPRTSTSSTTSGTEEPKISSPRRIKNVWVSEQVGRAKGVA
jgi:hypothetical protein